MKKQTHYILYLFTIISLFSCKKEDNPDGNGITSTPATFEWNFESNPSWSDEFNTDGAPDATKWGYDIGGTGWGNNELQYYTNGLNTSVSGGLLKIEARKEFYSGKNYTSARMISKNKGDWIFGRIEVKAMLPKGRGTWPAIWMLPTDWAYGGWPNSGEIDIMEHVGYDPNKVHITIHTKAYNHTLGTQKSSNTIVNTAFDAFHLYRIDWAPYGIRGYIDNEKIFEFSNPATGSDHWPFDQRFHLLLNIAVGGNWGGLQGVDDSIFPAAMQIDYVRVYRFTR